MSLGMVVVTAAPYHSQHEYQQLTSSLPTLDLPTQPPQHSSSDSVCQNAFSVLTSSSSPPSIVRFPALNPLSPTSSLIPELVSKLLPFVPLPLRSSIEADIYDKTGLQFSKDTPHCHAWWNQGELRFRLSHRDLKQYCMSRGLPISDGVHDGKHDTTPSEYVWVYRIVRAGAPHYKGATTARIDTVTAQTRLVMHHQQQQPQQGHEQPQSCSIIADPDVTEFKTSTTSKHPCLRPLTSYARHYPNTAINSASYFAATKNASFVLDNAEVSLN